MSEHVEFLRKQQGLPLAIKGHIQQAKRKYIEVDTYWLSRMSAAADYIEQLEQQRQELERFAQWFAKLQCNVQQFDSEREPCGACLPCLARAALAAYRGEEPT